MSKKFIEGGSKIRLIAEGQTRDLRGLTPGVAYVLHTDLLGLYLQPQPLQNVPGKVYGTILSKKDRILRGYRARAERGQSTGVLLNGEKGSGKTLLARMLARDSNLPVLLITENRVGEAFRELLIYASPCVVLFDEFEKLYPETADADKPDAGSQEDLLTLFDGLAEAKNLYIVTTNQRARIHDAMLNRPSRFFYSYNYGGLEKDFIEEYTKDNLQNAQHFDSVMEVTDSFNPVNFDMLQGLIEEMNRASEDARTVFPHLNLQRRNRYAYVYTVTIQEGSKTLRGKTLRLNEPLLDNVYIHIRKDDGGSVELDIEVCEIETLNNGNIIITTPSGVTVQLIPVNNPSWQHYDAF